MILSILTIEPQYVKFIMVDPKMLGSPCTRISRTTGAGRPGSEEGRRGAFLGNG